MATRIYLPSSGSAAVTPTTWNIPNQLLPYTFAGVTEKINSTMYDIARSTTTSEPDYEGLLRYVIGPLPAQTISGTVHLQMRAAEAHPGANATFCLAVKIIKSDGDDRAVLLGYTASDANGSPYEFAASLTNRRAYDASENQPITLTSQDATEGDYLVVEIGMRSNTGTSRVVTLRYGDTTNGDMPDDTESTDDYAPWVEFSQNIFGDDREGTASISGTGAVAGTSKKGGKGTASYSATGTLAAIGFAAMFGIATIAGTGAMAATGVLGYSGDATISGTGTVVATGEKAGEGAVSISGSGSIVIEGQKGGEDTATISGTGSIVFEGEKGGEDTASISGAGSFDATAKKAASGTATISGTGSIGTTATKATSGTAAISGAGSIEAIGTGGEGIPADIIIVWPLEHSTIPSGWTRETTLDTKYVLGASAGNGGGGSGGNSTHNHTSVPHSHTEQNHTHTFSADAASAAANGNAGTGAAATITHTHGSTSSSNPSATSSNTDEDAGTPVTLVAASNEPPYYEVVFIKSNGTASGLPDDSAVFFNSASPPTGWSVCNGSGGTPNFIDRSLKGATASGDSGATGGTVQSHSHSDAGTHKHDNYHSHSGKASIKASAESGVYALGSGLSDGQHTHSVSLTGKVLTYSSESVTVQTADGRPPFKELLPIQNTSGSESLPGGIIALWLGLEANIPTNWSRFATLDDYFLKCASSPGGSGGSSQHSHTTTAHGHTHENHNHSYSAQTGSPTRSGQDTGSASAEAHTHTWTIGNATPTVDTAVATINNCSAQATYPPYITAIFIRYEVFFGTATISGTGAVVATGEKGGEGTAAISGTGTVAATGKKGGETTISISGVGDITATGAKAAQGEVTISAVGSIAATGKKATTTTVSISGTGDVASSGEKEGVGTCSISGVGELAAEGSGPGGNVWVGTIPVIVLVSSASERTLMPQGYLRFCLHCHLVTHPDSRIYRNPHRYCPRCGTQYGKV